ncbi:MAG: YicC/YloC family endoribonuclease [Gammaproteobacteria bacterium]
MIRSMTAFARQPRQVSGGILCWELRSINHRFTEISVHLPEDLRSLEPAVRERVALLLKRGKIECSLRLQKITAYSMAGNASAELRINDELINQLLRAAVQVDSLAENPAPLNAMDLLRWPGVVQTPEVKEGLLAGEALALLDDIIGELVEARAREGAKIKAVIEQRCHALQDVIVQVRHRLPTILAHLRAKLTNRFTELSIDLDPARLEQEMLILIQKVDVDEELERLTMHVDEVSRLLYENEPVGRRLDFLMQELNREANTLGAKSVDIETSRAAIDLKVIVEQMREQIQNIE